MNKYFVNNNSQVYKFEKILIDAMTGAYSLLCWSYFLEYKPKRNRPRINLRGSEYSILIDPTLPTLVNISREEQIKFIEDNFESFVLHAVINRASNNTELINFQPMAINTSDEYFDNVKEAMDYFGISEDIGRNFNVYSAYSHKPTIVSEFYSGDWGYDND